jgi:NAD(P)H-hydrate repair Nnr-like enzyme with NAD(P)H-hydrate epimerase domain
MDPTIGGFVIEQLMELAGLSCAQVIQKEYDAGNFKNILVCVGPGMIIPRLIIRE